MRILIHSTLLILFFTFSLQSAEKETVVLKEWGNNIDYLEYVKTNSEGNLKSYIIKTVYGDLQDKEYKGGYNLSYDKYIMSCKDGIFLKQKTYKLNGEDLIKYTKFDQNYYQNDPDFGWKKIDTDKSQIKISEILCN